MKYEIAATIIQTIYDSYILISAVNTLSVINIQYSNKFNRLLVQNNTIIGIINTNKIIQLEI